MRKLGHTDIASAILVYFEKNGSELKLTSKIIPLGSDGRFIIEEKSVLSKVDNAILIPKNTWFKIYDDEGLVYDDRYMFNSYIEVKGNRIVLSKMDFFKRTFGQYEVVVSMSEKMYSWGIRITGKWGSNYGLIYRTGVKPSMTEQVIGMSSEYGLTKQVKQWIYDIAYRRLPKEI